MPGFPTRDFVALVPVAILTVGRHRAAPLRGLPRLRPPDVPGAPHGRVRRRGGAVRRVGARRRPGLRPAGDGRQLLRVRDRDRLRRPRPLRARRRGLARGARRGARRVLRARDVRRGRHVAPRHGERLPRRLRRHRDDEPRDLRARGLPPPRPAPRRGRVQVPRPRRDLVRALPLRRGAPLRRDRLDALLRAAARRRLPALPRRPRPRRRRRRLQGGGGPVPRLDAGRVRGRADAGDRVHGGGREDRRLRRARPDLPRRDGRRRRPGRRARRDHLRARGPDDDLRQPARAPAAEREADARVLVDRPRRLPARRRRVDGGRGRAREGARRDPLLPRRLQRDRHRRLRRRRLGRASHARRRRARRRLGPRPVRRPRAPPPGARVRDGGVPPLARGRPAHRGLHREALPLPGGRRGAALRARGPRRPHERARRVLLPARGRLHVHAPGGGRDGDALDRRR